MRKYLQSFWTSGRTKRSSLSTHVQIQLLEPRRMLANFDWSNPAGGTWNTYSDWSVNGAPATSLPASGDDVAFDIPGAYTVIYGVIPSATVRNMTAAQGSPTLAMANSTISVRGSLVVGGGATAAAYTIDGPQGIYVHGQIDVGAGAGSGNAQATFSLTNGADLSTRIVVAQTNIGTAAGPGQMIVNSGSVAQIYAHVGEQDTGGLTIDGDGSEVTGRLDIGGDGTVLVDNKGSLASRVVDVGSALGTHKQDATFDSIK